MLAATAPAIAQRVPIAADSLAPAPDYSDYASLVLRAPLVIEATVRGASRLNPAQASGVAPGFGRFYVEADVLALIRGTDPLPKRIGYLADVPLDAKGRPPKFSKQHVLLFASAVPNRPGTVQLARVDAQRPWSPAVDALSRKIVAEVVATDAPPEVTRVGNAFHVPGSLPGEGETQIFLNTADGRPVSLLILRRPGEAPRWAVALSEIVDESAVPPARGTLLWYRLACSLPATLPAASVATQSMEDATQAARDYALVIQSLWPCAHRAA
ncbi:hypothetical protein BH09PSE4_BH09PSE4_19850 [soil metagenome]